MEGLNIDMNVLVGNIPCLKLGETRDPNAHIFHIVIGEDIDDVMSCSVWLKMASKCFLSLLAILHIIIL